MKLERPTEYGEENLPIRKWISSLPVAVFVYDLKNSDNIVAAYQIDFSNRDDKAWMSRICVWAWTKGYSVEMMTVKDAEGRND